MQDITRSFLILSAIFFNLSAQALASSMDSSCAMLNAEKTLLCTGFEGPKGNRIYRLRTSDTRSSPGECDAKIIFPTFFNMTIEPIEVVSAKRTADLRVVSDPKNPSNQVLSSTTTDRWCKSPRTETRFHGFDDAIPLGEKRTYAFKFYVTKVIQSSTAIAQMIDKDDLPYTQLRNYTDDPTRLKLTILTYNPNGKHCFTARGPCADGNNYRFLDPYKINGWNDVKIEITYGYKTGTLGKLVIVQNGRVQVDKSGVQTTWDTSPPHHSGFKVGSYGPQYQTVLHDNLKVVKGALTP